MLDEKLAEDADLAAKQDIAKAEAEKAKAAAERQKKLAEDKRKQELEKKRLADLKAKADAKKKADAQKDFMKVAENALKNAQDAPPKAVLDKAPPKPGAAAGAKSATATPNIGPAAGAREGTDKVLTADKLSLLNVLMKNNVQRCWNINAGMEDAAKLVVKAEFKLSQDGRLIGEPLIKPAGAIASGPKYEDAANSAKRALVDCQPYSNLPPELYVNGWDYMSLVFDPSKMFH